MLNRFTKSSFTQNSPSKTFSLRVKMLRRFKLVITCVLCFQCSKKLSETSPSSGSKHREKEVSENSGNTKRAENDTTPIPQPSNDSTITVTADDRIKLLQIMGYTDTNALADSPNSDLIHELMNRLARRPRDQRWQDFAAQVRLRIPDSAATNSHR